jgi:hypothetical protein
VSSILLPFVRWRMTPTKTPNHAGPTGLPQGPRLIWRAPPAAVAAGLGALVLLLLVLITPLSSRDANEREGWRDFWWARLAPQSYAQDYFTTTQVLLARDTLLCSWGPEAPARAWQTLVKSPHATTLLRELASHARPAGRLYALAGLALIDSTSLGLALGELRSDTTHIMFRNDARDFAPLNGRLAVSVAEEAWLARHYGSAGYTRRALVDVATTSQLRDWALALRRMAATNCAT